MGPVGNAVFNGLLWLQKQMTLDPEAQTYFFDPTCRRFRHAADGRGAAGGVSAGKHGAVTELHASDGPGPAQTVQSQRPPELHPEPRPSDSQFLSVYPNEGSRLLRSLPLLVQPRFLNEALLLMAKVHYVQGRYRDAQGMCARVGLEELTQDEQPTYHLRLLAEAFVIKGT